MVAIVRPTGANAGQSWSCCSRVKPCILPSISCSQNPSCRTLSQRTATVGLGSDQRRASCDVAHVLNTTDPNTSPLPVRIARWRQCWHALIGRTNRRPHGLSRAGVAGSASARESCGQRSQPCSRVWFKQYSPQMTSFHFLLRDLLSGYVPTDR